MRILMIAKDIPYPPISGGTVRAYNLLRRIATRHQVWLATHLCTPDEAEGVAHLQEFCCHVATGYLRRRHPLAHLPGLLRYAAAGRPLELKFYYSNELADKIRRLASEVEFDIVLIEESQTMLYLEVLPPDTRSKYVLTFYDVVFERSARTSRIARSPILRGRAWLDSLMMRRWEPRYAEQFDRCIAVSETDRVSLIAANPRLRVDVIPNGVDTQVYQPLPRESTSPALLFIGSMSYPPCNDAVLYFTAEILPRIRRIVPNVEMWIVGSDPSPEVMQLNGNGVHVTGRVDDVRPYYGRITVCVVPLRAGGGTRLKILEAMALGRPVVSTTIGCEGLEVADGEHLLIADSPERFAEQTVCLLTDRALYERIATNARQLVVTRYDWDVIAGQLMQICTEVIS